MLFHRALTTNEIAAIYAAGSNGVCHSAVPVRPILSVSRVGEQLKLEWLSQAGLFYQLQSTTNSSPAAWTSEGLPFTGTGGLLGTHLPIGSEPVKFFRLRVGN